MIKLDRNSLKKGKPVRTRTMKNPISTLIAAKPDRLRDGLHLLLSTAPQVSEIEQTDDADSTFEVIVERPPGLVVLDTNLDATSVNHLLERIKHEAPGLPCLVVVANDEQQRAACNAGADAVLLKGFSSSELLALIERLIGGESHVEVAL
jgi:DNA-binding NarL/FixJ family response regulator